MTEIYSEVVKRPAECSDSEVQKFCLLATAGGQIQTGLEQRIRQNGLLLSYIYTKNELVAVGALKRPNANYRNTVFKKANADKIPEKFPIELGWFCVSPTYRNRGLSHKIARGLLSKPEGITKGIYATTAADAMKRCLLGHDFILSGSPYKSQLLPHNLQLLIRMPETDAIK